MSIYWRVMHVYMFLLFSHQIWPKKCHPSWQPPGPVGRALDRRDWGILRAARWIATVGGLSLGQKHGGSPMFRKDLRNFWWGWHLDVIICDTAWWWLEPWNFEWLSIYGWEWNNHSNWRTPSFFRGVVTPMDEFEPRETMTKFEPTHTET